MLQNNLNAILASLLLNLNYYNLIYNLYEIVVH